MFRPVERHDALLPVEGCAATHVSRRAWWAGWRRGKSTNAGPTWWPKCGRPAARRVSAMFIFAITFRPHRPSPASRSCAGERILPQHAVDAVAECAGKFLLGFEVGWSEAAALEPHRRAAPRSGAPPAGCIRRPSVIEGVVDLAGLDLAQDAVDRELVPRSSARSRALDLRVARQGAARPRGRPSGCGAAAGRRRTMLLVSAQRDNELLRLAVERHREHAGSGAPVSRGSILRAAGSTMMWARSTDCSPSFFRQARPRSVASETKPSCTSSRPTGRCDFICSSSGDPQLVFGEDALVDQGSGRCAAWPCGFVGEFIQTP